MKRYDEIQYYLVRFKNASNTWSTYGSNVGFKVGDSVGSNVGDAVGLCVGSSVGLVVGLNVGDCTEERGKSTTRTTDEIH